MKKTCKTCKKTKDIKLFAKHKDNGKVCYYYCKDCEHIRDAKRYYETWHKHRLRRNNYNKKYFESEKGKAINYRIAKEMRIKYKYKNQARYKLRWEIRVGRMKRLPCEVCGNVKTDAHHYLGYEGDNWKKVKFLCKKHHFEQHIRISKYEFALS